MIGETDYAQATPRRRSRRTVSRPHRGNLRATIFHKEADFEAFERILHEALQIHQIELYSFQLMPNHYHLVLRPLVDGEMSRFMGWVGGTHTMRYHAHYHTSGMGHVYQQRYKSFPIQDDEHFFVVCRYVERNALRAGLVRRAEDWRWGSLWRWLQKPEPNPPLLSTWPMSRLPGWVDRVNTPLSEAELAAVRLSAQRGRPLGDDGWVESIARRLNLESTMRPRGRKRVRFPKDQTKRPDPFNFAILVYGTVLPWQNDAWGGFPAANSQAFNACLKKQTEELKIIRTRYPDALICYAGDFNQDLNDKHYYGSHIGKDSLQNALHELELECHTSKELDPVSQLTSKTHSNIDHICLSVKAGQPPKAWPATYEALRGLTDHFGVSVTIVHSSVASRPSVAPLPPTFS